jgi:hypothetical protein
MKLLKAFVVMLVAAALIVPAVSFAEDRLSLSGQMRTRAFHNDIDVDGVDSDTDTYANQRLRIAGKIAVAEGVSVTFRTDITEGTNWGDSSDFKNGIGTSIGPIRTNGFGHGRSGAQQQWDRAHLDITKGAFHLRAGQQYVGSGGTWALDTQDSGLALDIESGVPVKLFMIVDKDNVVYDDDTEETTDGADAFLYGAFANFKGDNFKSRLILSGYNDGDEQEVYLVGVNGTLNLDAIKLFGELDFFTGDANDAAGVDAFGTQGMIDASMAASDTFTVGAQLFYAAGDDEDKQYVRLGNGFNGWDPIYDVGTSLSNEEIVFGNPFDFTGKSAGVVAGRLYADIKMSDSLNLGISAAYAQEEEDAIVESDGYAVAAGLKYAILENTSFQLQLQYEEFDVEEVATGDTSDYDAFRAGTGFFVNF